MKLQTQGQSRAEIRKQCGRPENRNGNNLFYKKGNDRYRLYFNENDELESITLERAE
ncbi:MAG: hypothetical protein KZQ58_07840 [gamma proteobacterium symbiont of Bathyaustriella thionipta]|nr:hypothetical protein [gamma proteobacterium symbiont of Bathyaustriella thionipta]